MLRDYKYTSIATGNRPVVGILQAKNTRHAKRIASEISKKNNVNLKSVIEKKTYIYTVKLPNGKKITGQQEAFSKEEVINAFKKIGYQKVTVNPVLLNFTVAPPRENVMMFIQLCSFLLKEKLSFDRVLHLLAEDEQNKTLKTALKKIESELKKGKSGEEIFPHYENIFGKFPAYMMGLATKSGNMSEVYDATAKFMERDFEYKKNLKSAFMTPMLTVLATLGAVAYYIISIFPATASMFVKFGIEVPPMTAATLNLSSYLGANWFGMFMSLVIPIFALMAWWSTPKGRAWRDHAILKIPVIGSIMHKGSIEIFFRVFAAIYSGSENNIDSLKASSEACRNAYIEKNIKTIAVPLMLKEGMALVPALNKAKVFNKTTLSRLKSGAEVGNILQSAKLIAMFYEKETTFKMKGVINSIQSIIGAFIAIVITALTVISAEVAMVSPPTPGM